jgi:hypothetical protein
MLIDECLDAQWREILGIFSLYVLPSQSWMAHNPCIVSEVGAQKEFEIKSVLLLKDDFSWALPHEPLGLHWKLGVI